jgi:hypothetical protein
MQTLTLKNESNFNKLAVDLNRVKRIKLGVDNPSAPRLWILYFYGEFRNKKEYVIRIWFFKNEKERSNQLRYIQTHYPYIQIQ